MNISIIGDIANNRANTTNISISTIIIVIIAIIAINISIIGGGNSAIGVDISSISIFDAGNNADNDVNIGGSGAAFL